MEDKEKLILKLKSVEQNKHENKTNVYEVADALNLEYKKSTCKNCTEKLWTKCAEILGMIEKNYNGRKWQFIHGKPVICEGVVYNENTPDELVEKFVEKHKGYYLKTENNEE